MAVPKSFTAKNPENFSSGHWTQLKKDLVIPREALRSVGGVVSRPFHAKTRLT
jgi:hypothetical protein